jgi:hypothetical protein
MAAEKFCPNTKPLANAITPRIPISVVASLVKPLSFQLTITLLSLIGVAADFAETPSPRGLGMPLETAMFSSRSYCLTHFSSGMFRRNRSLVRHDYNRAPCSSCLHDPADPPEASLYFFLMCWWGMLLSPLPGTIL